MLEEYMVRIEAGNDALCDDIKSILLGGTPDEDKEEESPKEYIERGELLKKSVCVIEGHKEDSRMRFCGVPIEDVKSQPAADVAPVVHGEWIERKSRFGGWHYDCPFCDDGFYMKERAKSKPNYCPNCGAKMDGGCE